MTNCACIYNVSFAPQFLKPFLPSNWQPKLTLYYEHIWNAFFIHGLLVDHTAHSTTLQLPNKASSQADRLHAALEACNRQMSGTGQIEWNHACEKCAYVFPGDDGRLCKSASYFAYLQLISVKGRIHSVVTDGIMLGHPCCASTLHCKNPLPNNHAMYCIEHEHLKNKCAVITCN